MPDIWRNFPWYEAGMNAGKEISKLLSLSLSFSLSLEITNFAELTEKLEI